MEVQTETSFLSELSFVSIKNYSDSMIMTLLPHIEELLTTAELHAPPNTLASAGIGRVSEMKEISAVVSIHQSSTTEKTSARTYSVKEHPLEIVLKTVPDEKTLQSLMRLVGEYSPTSMSVEASCFLENFLEKNHLFDKFKYQRSGIRIVVNIPKQTFKPLYGLPAPFSYFTGRESELKELEKNADKVQVISTNETAKLNSPPREYLNAQISGTGGIGKTQLVNYFVRKQFKDKVYDWVIWLNGGEDDATAESNLRSQLTSLGQSLGLDVELSLDVLCQLIYDRLSEKGRGIVVVDNTPRYAIIKQFLPEQFEHTEIAVILTTRNSLSFGPQLKKIILDVFTLEDAKVYIGKMIEGVSIDDAELLANTLDRYPLAITSAICYITSSECTIPEYCYRYSAIKLAQKEYLETPVSEDDPYLLEHIKRKRKYEASISAVVRLALDQIKVMCTETISFELVETILKSSSYLSHEDDIPKVLLGKWLPDDEGDLKINKALELLRRFSLLQEGGERETYIIHKVIQDVLKLGDSREDSGKLLLLSANYIKDYLGHLDVRFEAAVITPSDERKLLVIRPHAVALSKSLSLQPRIDTFLESEAMIHEVAGISLKILGEYTLSKQCFAAQLDCYEKMTGFPTLAYCNCRVNLANQLRCCGDAEAAVKMLQETLVVLTHQYGNNIDKTYSSWLALANALAQCGDKNTALLIVERLLPYLTLTYGESNFILAGEYSNLGWLKVSCGNPQGGAELIEKAIPIFKEAYGDDHYIVAGTNMNLGIALSQCGDWRNAILRLEEALPILRRHFGNNHPDVAKCLMNLATTTFISGNKKEAKLLYEEAILIFKTNFGMNHYNVAQCLDGLGKIMIERGDYQDAIKTLKEAISIFKIRLVEGNIEIEKARITLGLAMLGNEQLEEAKSIIESALSALKSILGPRANQIAYGLMSLGQTMLACHDPQAAITQLNEALDIFRSTTPNNHEYIGRCLFFLGKATSENEGEPLKARELLQDALLLFRSYTAISKYELSECLRYLGLATLRCGDLKKALVLFKESYSIYKIDLFDKNSTMTHKFIYDVAKQMLDSGHALDAVNCYKELLDMLQSSPNAEPSEIGICLRYMGRAMLNINLSEAKDVLEKALPILEKYKLLTEAAICMSDIGFSLLDTDPRMAGVPLEKALPILKSSLGEDHIEVGLCLRSLGFVLLRSDHTDKAEARFNEALPILRKEKHSQCGNCLLNLGSIMMSKDLKKAKILFEEALSLLKITFGDRHSDVAMCLQNLGWVNIYLNNYDAAVVVFKGALLIFEDKLDPYNPSIAGCLMGLGKALLMCNDPEQSKKYLTRALTIFKQSFPDTHQHVRNCSQFLSEATMTCSLLNDNGHNPGKEIRVAAANGSSDELKKLLTINKKYTNIPDGVPGKGLTALHWAVKRGRPDNVEVLLENIGFTSVKDARGFTALDYAIEGKNIQILQCFLFFLLTHYAKETGGESSMLAPVCVKHNNESALKLLIFLHWPIDGVDAKTGQSALHIAVIQGNKKFVKMLIEAGADPRQEDHKGQSAITLAENNSDILEILAINLNQSLKL
ncbi:MAG: tetratricopeptide repeat protein [Gammaproteobacteria bacterium]|nr:tetratricopeptide repeat protein [Gammaproteobacteria bacterium]